MTEQRALHPGRDDAATMTAPRLEVKIPLPAAYVPQAEAWVRVHPAHWRRAYPPRQVNNVYFDTPGYAGLQANLGGIAERAKLRLRWYGEELACVRGGILELKRKQGGAGWKHLCAVVGELALAEQPWNALLRELRAGLDAPACRWLDYFPLPVLVNHYRRAYYATPDAALRLTIDTQLVAYSQRMSGRPNLSRPAPLASQIVVEFKAAADAATTRRLSAMLASFPAPVERFSKYVHGMLAGLEFAP